MEGTRQSRRIEHSSSGGHRCESAVTVATIETNRNGSGPEEDERAKSNGERDVSNEVLGGIHAEFEGDGFEAAFREGLV